ncbi:MAG: AAA family ATPase [Solirubrobacteraceae bacterium]
MGDVASPESDVRFAGGELPLLGRAEELASLSSALADASAGRGGLVLLAGEPGIGKTRLAQALGEQAGRARARVVWARGWDGGGAPAFWPWVQVIRELTAGATDDELRAALGPGARWVASIAPELRERLGLPEAGDALESDRARFALFDAVALFLRALGADRPLLIVLDDLQSADPASLLLLTFLARMLDGMAVLVVTTHHDAGPRRDPEVEAIFGELSRFGRRLDLTGLSDRDLRALVVHRSGGEPSEELVRSLLELTDGNPLYSDAVVRLLAAQRRLGRPLDERGRPPLPDSVRDAIRRRLLPLPPATRELLEIAAVEGREFALATLDRVAATGRAETLERLDPALSTQLVEDVPGRVGRLRFVHGLIRETVYGDIAAARRARLHVAVGESLERDGAASSDLAYHFVEGAAAADPARALQHAERAGHEALAGLSYERAAELFDAALGALAQLPEPDEHRRGELLLARGQAQMQSGGDAARVTLRDAIALAEATGDAELRARAAVSMGGFGLSPGIVDDEFVAVLEAALDALDPAGTRLRAQLLVRLAVALYYAPEAAERREALVQEAVEIARALDDPATLAFVLDQGQIATNGPDKTPRGLTWAQELFALADAAGDPELAVRARSWQIDLLLELDDLPGADMAIETLDRIATESRDPRARAYIPLHRARRAMMEGRLEDCERLIDEGIQLGWSLQDSTVPILAGAQLFWLRLGQGRIAELEDAVRQFADQLPGMPVWRAALGMLYLHTGRRAEARREYERLAGAGFPLPRDNVWLLGMAVLAEQSEAFHDADGAARIEALLEPFAARNVVTPEAIFAGPVTRYLALTAATRGDHDAALAHLGAARAACERLGYLPMLAVLDVDEARLLARRRDADDVERARGLIDRARDRAEAIGVPRLDERLDRAAALLPGAEDAPAAPPAVQAGPATAVLRREGDVWRIEYEGRVLHVRDAKGMRHLGVLLAHPGVELHATDLALQAEGPAAATAATADGLAVRADTGDAGPALDAQAKAAYRARVQELREEVEEAESFNDPERAAAAREELAFIAAELGAAVGLGGRDRRVASAAERARVNVTRALRREIRRIGDQDASLGQELQSTVRTGTFCVFEPDVRRPVRWEVDHG